MKFTLLYLIGFIYFELFNNGVFGSVFYNNVEVTWSEAHDICHRNGGTLADYSSISEADSEHLKQQVTSGRRIWINGFHNRTSFMWTYGCKDLVNNGVGLPNKYFGRDISLANCIDFCGDYTFVAMKIFTCYCISSTDIAVADDPNCHVKCRGDSSDICGGRNQASIYKTYNPRELPFEELGGDGNCFYVEKNQSLNTIPGVDNKLGKMAWGIEDCDIELEGFVCQTHNVNPTTDVYKVFYSNRNWASAQGFCSWNGTLGNIYNVTQKVETMRSNERYWIGLYRKDFLKDMPDRCDTVIIGENGEINETITDPCTERHTVLCERDVSGINKPELELAATSENEKPATTVQEQATPHPTPCMPAKDKQKIRQEDIKAMQYEVLKVQKENFELQNLKLRLNIKDILDDIASRNENTDVKVVNDLLAKQNDS